MSDGKVSVDDATQNVFGLSRRIYVERFVSDNGCADCKYRTNNGCTLFGEPLFTRERDGGVEYRVLDECEDAINADMADDAIRDARFR